MASSAIDLQPYALLSDEACEPRTVVARQRLGERLCILGHHYRRNEVFRHAGFSGDSQKLSRLARIERGRIVCTSTSARSMLDI